MQVSVIVPLYNKADHIVRCVQSIAAQTFRDFELIIVDDGSTDRSVERLAGLMDDGRFRIISQANAGPGAARNRGAAEASGEYLAWLDGDDEWAPEYLDHNLKAIRATPQAAAVTSGYVEQPAGADREAFWRGRGLKEGLFRVHPDTPPLHLVHVLAYMSCWNTIVRADVFRRFGGFYGRTRALYAEDAWLWVQVLLNEPVLLRFEPLTVFHREASELSANLRGVRPVEPFLIDPEPVRQTCPAELRELLRRFLAIRALKTACVLGYWGDWRRARELRRRYTGVGDVGLPLFWPALICSTPPGGVLGKLWRWRAR